MKDAPPLPVQRNRDAFREYVKANDLGAIEPFYSAYPDGCGARHPCGAGEG